jgi:YVTN family beta-propeller protein
MALGCTRRIRLDGRWLQTTFALALATLWLAPAAWAARARVHEDVGFELFESPQANPIALSPDGTRLYVALTTANTVEVYDTATRTRLAIVPVGIDPVALAVRPDGRELWVANHVSDSVSVVDTDAASATLHTVVETIDAQDAAGVTTFDEPVGIAFASDAKAYVALSSRNRVAIVNAGSYAVTGTLPITAQDPRAMAVRDGRLYVAAFESGNQSELSACLAADGTEQCTFGFNEVLGVAGNPNLPGVPKNIVVDPDVPDRDLFVFDTATDLPVGAPVEGVGTLLYGVAVDAGGRVFVSNTDARNHHLDGNGLAAQPPEGLGLGLADLENRAFRNRVTRIDCPGGACGAPQRVDLEPGPGLAVPTPLATPYGIAASADGTVLVVTAAGSDRVATLDAATLAVLATLDVGANPRGVAFRSTGATGTAYVLNTLGNTVSVVNVGPGGALSLVATIGVAIGWDKTPDAVRRGRIAFHSARASTTGTFACASCHPDAHVDQLLWFIGAECSQAGCDQEEQRSTMPVRGLRGTLPLHWDGTLGDPFGGRNGDVGQGGTAPPNCSLANGEQDCFRHLVDASLSGVMCEQPSCAPGPSGLAGAFTVQEREDLATYMQRVAYPPARSRLPSDAITTTARDGFADFFMDQGGNGGNAANTCADTTGGCHALPLGVSTNSVAVGGFEAPTMRGMTDRFLQFSGGFTNPQEVLDIVAAFTTQGVIPWDPAVGLDELVVFSSPFVVFNPTYGVLPTAMFQMFEEASTGHSGALGRQVSVNPRTAGAAQVATTTARLATLEAADARGVVNVRGTGLRDSGAGLAQVTLSYRSDLGLYQGDAGLQLTRAQLLAEAAAGTTELTLTAHLRENVGRDDFLSPLVATSTTGNGLTGDPPLPVLPAGNPMTLSGVTVRSDAITLVDGQPVSATITCQGGTFTPIYCSSNVVRVTLAAIPPNGTHVLQLQNPRGALSNELPFCVGPVAGCL